MIVLPPKPPHDPAKLINSEDDPEMRMRALKILTGANVVTTFLWVVGIVGLAGVALLAKYLH